jgi:hypothetical protein
MQLVTEAATDPQLFTDPLLKTAAPHSEILSVASTN